MKSFVANIGTQKTIPKLQSLIDGVCIGVLESDIDYKFNEMTNELLIGTIDITTGAVLALTIKDISLLS